jgi:DNA invertase Pin-like site-specific DNA recombinase
VSKAICYTRVSTEEQAKSGLSLDFQRDVCIAEAVRRGFASDDILLIADDGYSAKDDKRPGLQKALTMLRNKEASVLIVSKIDRFSRSVYDAARILRDSEKEGWAFVTTDLQIDLTTPAGRAMFGSLMVFAQFERELIGQRTKDALQKKREQGWVPQGGSVFCSTQLEEYIRLLRDEQRLGFSKISRMLNEANVPTVRGGKKWYPMSVQQIHKRITTSREEK